jgi:hypothetical protein
MATAGAPLEIDKEKLKAAFDVSHFDFNAILRGMQLTVVGGSSISPPARLDTPDGELIVAAQHSELFKTRPSSSPTTTCRLP